MNSATKPLTAIAAAALSVAFLLIVAVTGSMAATGAGPSETPPPQTPAPPAENPNPSTAECQPGQPYNQYCPTIVTFEFPKTSFVENGKVKLVKLGCNQSCNHVNFQATHGKKVAAKGDTWFTSNYLPELTTELKDYAKQQLRRHGKLEVKVNVCVHPPGPQNFCKTGKVTLRTK